MSINRETELARKYWEAFNVAFAQNKEWIAQARHLLAQGLSEMVAHIPDTPNEAAWREVQAELLAYLQETQEPFEALGWRFRIDLSGEVEAIPLVEIEAKQHEPRGPREAAARYLSRRPERNHPHFVRAGGRGGSGATA